MKKRELTYFEEIVDIQPHYNADRLEVATVRGWKAVVLKDEFKIGDKIVYCEIDSILPENEEAFSFLEKYQFRIRTQRLRGILSQGLIVNPNKVTSLKGVEYEQGKCLDEIIGVKKYEKPVKDPGFFQSIDYRVKETGAERIQNVKSELLQFIKKQKNLSFTITEKIDGQSTTYLFKNNTLNVMLHSVSKGIYNFDTKVLTVNDKVYENEKALSYLKSFSQGKYVVENYNMFKDIATKYNGIIQGEVIGRKTNGAISNYYKVNFDVDFYAFNVCDLFGRKQDVQIAKNLGFKIAPTINDKDVYIEFDKFLNGDNNMTKLLEIVQDIKSNISNVGVEGVVIRFNNDTPNIKIISNKFLLKEK